MTTIIGRDPKTGNEVRVAYYVDKDGREILQPLSPNHYDVEAMSPRKLMQRAAFSEAAASRFGTKGTVNEFISEAVPQMMEEDDTPRESERERKRARVLEIVGKRGIEAARQVGPGRRRAKIIVSRGPRTNLTFEELPVPDF
ncbi:MAG: hypothetical protein ACREB9_02245 [Thermoplasmata archaeon]